MNGGYLMKVIMLEAPKTLRGILRLLFGIKKEENI